MQIYSTVFSVSIFLFVVLAVHRDDTKHVLKPHVKTAGSVCLDKTNFVDNVK